MNKSLRLVGLVAAAGVLLAACSTPAAAPTAVPAKPGEPTKAAAPAAKTIRWRTRPGDAAEQKVYEELN
ncbi:MAG: sugar ABC transporter substrate-binding protein, partial [Thermoflexales bacterium]